MRKIDPEKQRLVGEVNRLRDEIRSARLQLKYYNHREQLRERGIILGKDYIFGTLADLLISENPVERCVFDDSRLVRIEPILPEPAPEGEPPILSTIYKCPRCRVRYLSPLTEEDRLEKEKKHHGMIFRYNS